MENKTYSFIEAVNSGKRFRRVNWSDSMNCKGWYEFSDKLLYEYSSGKCIEKITKDILNRQYILEEKTITITESQFDDAWDKGKQLDLIKKELGF